ncbi:MAG: hypothetical protein RR362_03550 [Raoultibacter sp.]
MPDENKYTIISVSADDEDEIVIQAGAPAAGRKREAAKRDPSFSSVDPDYDEPVRKQPASDVSAASPQSSTDAFSAPEKATAPIRQSKQERFACEVEELNRTQEDLDNVPPMSKMQKTILAVIAVFAVAALVYYFFFVIR